MSEAYRQTAVRKKVNKNVYVYIDNTKKIVKIINNINGHDEVHLKFKTLAKLTKIVNQTINTKE